MPELQKKERLKKLRKIDKSKLTHKQWYKIKIEIMQLTGIID